MEKVGDTLRERIVIVDDTRFHRAMAADILSRAGYLTTEVADGARAIDMVHVESPDLLILDSNMPGVDGHEVCRRLKADPFKNHIPILMFVSESTTEDKITSLRSGADGFLAKPYTPEELLTQVQALLRRSFDNDPLTKLPAAPYLHRQIDARLAHNLPTGVAYFTLDRFKAYNVAYGHAAGDHVLLTLARLAVECLPTRQAFVGHLGSDDFIAVMNPEALETFAQTLLERFREARTREFYKAEDLAHGYIILKDRRGQAVQWNLVSLSIALVSNERRALVNYVQVSDILAEVMNYLKSQGGDRWGRDRRSG